MTEKQYQVRMAAYNASIGAKQAQRTALDAKMMSRGKFDSPQNAYLYSRYKKLSDEEDGLWHAKNQLEYRWSQTWGRNELYSMFGHPKNW